MTEPVAPPGPLLSLADLSVWTRQSPLTDVPFAELIINAASELVRTVARQPTWTAASAPARARQIASHLAARSYLNPDSVVAEGGVGPLGGDRTVEEMARALHLTALEREELEGMAPDGDLGGGGGLWVQPIVSSGYNDFQPNGLFVNTNPPSDWMLPWATLDPPVTP